MANTHRSTWWERALALPVVALCALGLGYLAAPLGELTPPTEVALTRPAAGR